MAQIKDRKIFALNNFRGLDKENKLLKVAPFRAADGKNFMIDSDTNKTRPAFKYLKEPPFVLGGNESIIDWVRFRDIDIYVTNLHIYFYALNENDGVLNESSVNDLIIKSSFGSLDFSNKKPLFREEKECLFIFGLGGVFVFSTLRNDDQSIYRYVLYDINKKPVYYPRANEDSETTSLFSPLFDELPTPYEPTIWNGEPFEDVNLLSKVTKYKLFSTGNEDDQGMIKHMMPTHFDPSKHGSFQYIQDNKKIIFYGGLFDEVGVFPRFLGRQDENFDGVPTDYGELLNASTPVEIEGYFYPALDWNYTTDEATTPTIKTISELLGLKRSEFFTMKTKTTDSLPVFEYLLNYIKLNPDTFSGLNGNKVFQFKLNVEYKAVYRNSTSNDIVNEKKERKALDIFIQIQRYDISQYEASLVESLSSGESTNGVYPAYPTPSVNIAVGQEYNLTPSPLKVDVLSIAPILSLAANHIADNKPLSQSNGNLWYKGRMYKRVENYQEQQVSVSPYYQEWMKSTEDASIVFGDYNSIHEIGLTPPSGQILEGSFLFTQTGQSFNYQNPELMAWLKSTIERDIDLLSGTSGWGYIKYKIQTYWTDGVSYFNKGITVYTEFSYTKESSSSYDIMTSYSIVYNIDSGAGIELADTLYSFSFDEKQHAFILKIKDYLFDYNNEPAIDIEIKFEKNPDYDLIARSSFGTNFGAENRLFLAGHPDYPNIDRYNVSNDLLGDNVKKQSYELSYFPSKNYRVIGGKGAINGYVIATDTQMYVTKSYYPNDNNFFIRTRQIDDNGKVSYFEYKTNIKQTPLNERCIVSFYNDILMLTDEGLVGIEIASNVLTNERMVKHRDGFINKDLVSAIKAYDKSKIFMVENNFYLYIFIGDLVYVADSRYTDKNTNGIIDNLSYEIVKWENYLKYRHGQFDGNELVLLEENGKMFYHMQRDNNDDQIEKIVNGVGYPSSNIPSGMNTVFQETNLIQSYIENPLHVSFRFYGGYKQVGLDNVDYDLQGDGVTANILISDSFVDVVDGDTLYLADINKENFYPFTVIMSEDRSSIVIPTIEQAVKNGIYRSIKDVPLYIDSMWIETVESEDVVFFKLSPYEPSEIHLDKLSIDPNDEYYFTNEVSSGVLNAIANREKLIDFEWVGGITDFGNNTMEKTTFKAMIYATKQSKSNTLFFGYRTMKSVKRITDARAIDLSNPITLESVDFNSFSLRTFAESGMMIPMKENNFLYMQFAIRAKGNVEINAIEILYKNNRLIKSIS